MGFITGKLEGVSVAWRIPMLCWRPYQPDLVDQTLARLLARFCSEKLTNARVCELDRLAAAPTAATSSSTIASTIAAAVAPAIVTPIKACVAAATFALEI